VTGTLTSRLARCAATAVLAAAGALGLGVSPAQAADGVATYSVRAEVEADGMLAVRATLGLEGAPAQVQQRFATTLDSGRDARYRFTLSDVTASVAGQQVAPTVTTDGDYRVVTVPVSGGAGPVTLSYRVEGAAFRTDEQTTTLNWRLLQGLNLPVRSFDAVVTTPGLFRSVDCYAGAPAAPGPCGSYAGGTHDDPFPVFSDGPRGQGEVVGVVVRFDSRLVAANEDRHRVWTLDNAFSAAPLPLGLAALAALLGGLGYWWLHRRFGRDAAGAALPATVGTFRPVGDGQSAFTLTDDLRPGEVGTLADERVDPIDVTASVLDLAVRNHLRVTQLPRGGEFKPTEWEFRRVESGAALLPFEKTLLDVVAPADGSPRRLGELGPLLGRALPTIQAQLYDEVVGKGWFAARPDRTRGRWARLGWVALAASVVVAGLLVAFTSFGLLGLVLVALAAGVGVLGQAMPARTAKGTSTLAGLGVLRGLLLTQPTDQMPVGREHEELSSVLPYAVVLGGADRWLDGIARINDAARADHTELSWYHGPAGWQLSDLPDSLRNFIRALEGTLVARP